MKNGRYRAPLARVLLGRRRRFLEQIECLFSLSAGVRLHVGRGNSELFAEQTVHLFKRISHRLKRENALGSRPFCASHGGRIAVIHTPPRPFCRGVPGTIDWPITAGHIAIISSRNARNASRHSSGIATGKTPLPPLDSSSCRRRGSVASTKFLICWGRRYGRNFRNTIAFVDIFGPDFPEKRLSDLPLLPSQTW